MADRRDAGGVEEFPEEVRRVRVGVARGPGFETWVYADEEEEEVG